ncbi:MAG: 30S ribosomal protein S14 [Alphaproteobacteria bacterium]|nr:MAG: 30S ribosomal protein S14 [Alphaproteobacteria bacterium]
MAKLSSVEKNKRRQRMVKSYGPRRKRLKAIISNRALPIEERFAAQVKLAQLPRNSSPVRVRNRCELTGRPRGYYRRFRLCRIMLRELAQRGMLPGVTKSSW